jgi:ABC-2 type transport system permease protein
VNTSEREQALEKLPLTDVFVHEGLVRGTLGTLKDIWARRELLDLLIRREIKAKYKDSVLGLVWSLVRPIVMLVIYYMVMGRVLGADRGIDHFAVYIYCGLAVWSLFQESVAGGTASIVANSGIIKKTRLPREILPLTSIGVALFNFFIQLVILVVFVLATSGINTSVNFLHFPLAIAIVLVWGTAFALLLSAANVYLRDVQYLTEVALMIGFYASPIIYPWSLAAGHMNAIVQDIYLANPITLAIMGTQFVWWKTEKVDYPWPEHLDHRMLIALAVGFVVLFIASRVFARLQRDFAQEI